MTLTEHIDNLCNIYSTLLNQYLKKALESYTKSNPLKIYSYIYAVTYNRSNGKERTEYNIRALYLQDDMIYIRLDDSDLALDDITDTALLEDIYNIVKQSVNVIKY